MTQTRIDRTTHSQALVLACIFAGASRLRGSICRVPCTELIGQVRVTLSDLRGESTSRAPLSGRWH